MINLKSLLIMLLLTISGTAFAQLNYNATNNGGVMEFADLNGKSLLNEKYDPGIEGIPFLVADFAPADLTTKSGLVVKKVMVKLNIESNELYYMDSFNKVMIALEGTVKRIGFTGLLTNEIKPYLFKCGYPAIDQQKQSFYYQVLTEGKIELLKKEYKTIETYKNDITGEKRKEFVEASRYYIYANNNIEPLKNDKEKLLDLMKDKEAAVSKFLDENKINFKKVPDIQKLLEYYNKLP